MHREDCSNLLERQFTSFVIGFRAVLVGVMAYRLISFLWFRYFVLGPILYEIQQARRHEILAEKTP